MFQKKTCLSVSLGVFVLAAVILTVALTGNIARAASTLTFKPSADAYVIETSASTNFGTATNVRVDSSPITRSYLRFNVSGLNGAAVQSAKLRLYANSGNTTGYTVSAESNNAWTETGLTYANAPAPGGQIAVSPAIVAGQWIEADVTSYVKADGAVNLVLSTSSTTNTSLGSRESGANAPQLVITAGSPPPTSPGPTATRPAATQPPATKPAPTQPAPPSNPTNPPALTKINLTKGPELIYLGNNTTMKIFWQWTANAAFTVNWGTSAAYGSTSPAIGAYDTTNHLYSYTITGLTPGAKYYYRVVTGQQYAAATFLAAPNASATTLKFVSYGDTRTNPGTHNAVAGQVVSLFNSDPAYQTVNAFVGDLVANGGTDSYWTNEFYSTSLPNIRTEIANMVLMPVMGNHEGDGNLFKRYFPEPFAGSRYYSFDYGPAHFVMLDQFTSYSSGSAQYNWMKADLAATTKKWKIVVLHMPGWSANGGHPNDATTQKVLEPVFEQYKVALVVGGHNHYYARAMVNGIAHLTLGTGGAPVYAPASGQPNIVKTYKGNGYSKFEINGSTMTGSFISSSGSVVDTFSITR